MSNKVRLHELARELAIESSHVVEICEILGIAVVNHLSTVSELQADAIRGKVMQSRARPQDFKSNAHVIDQASSVAVLEGAVNPVGSSLSVGHSAESAASVQPGGTGLSVAGVQASQTARPCLEPLETGPATSLFFMASFASLFANVVISLFINSYNSMQKVSGEFDVTAYLVALWIGSRHVFRLSLFDKYVVDGLMPAKSPLIYWLIWLGTIVGSVSFSLSSISSSWYYIAGVVPYLCLFLLFGFLMIFGVRSVEIESGRELTLISFIDLLSIWMVFELYELGVGKQSRLGHSFWMAFFSCGILFYWEIRKIYLDAICKRYADVWRLLAGT